MAPLEPQLDWEPKSWNFGSQLAPIQNGWEDRAPGAQNPDLDPILRSAGGFSILFSRMGRIYLDMDICPFKIRGSGYDIISKKSVYVHET